MNKRYKAKRKDTGEYVHGSLLYDSDQDCFRIVTDFFDIEEPKLDSQFGITAYEIKYSTIEKVDI